MTARHARHVGWWTRPAHAGPGWLSPVWEMRPNRFLAAAILLVLTVALAILLWAIWSAAG